jgi:hypothetical protein
LAVSSCAAPLQAVSSKTKEAQPEVFVFWGYEPQSPVIKATNLAGLLWQQVLSYVYDNKNFHQRGVNIMALTMSNFQVKTNENRNFSPQGGILLIHAIFGKRWTPRAPSQARFTPAFKTLGIPLKEGVRI